MSLPLWDPIDLPPDAVMVDVNSLDEPERSELQGVALALWIEETGESFDDFAARDWDDNEGIFVVVEDGVNVAVLILAPVEE